MGWSEKVKKRRDESSSLLFVEDPADRAHNWAPGVNNNSCYGAILLEFEEAAVTFKEVLDGDSTAEEWFELPVKSNQPGYLAQYSGQHGVPVRTMGKKKRTRRQARGFSVKK